MPTCAAEAALPIARLIAQPAVRRSILIAAALSLLGPAAVPGQLAGASSPLVAYAAPVRLVYPSTAGTAASAVAVTLTVSRPVMGQAQVLTWDGALVREILHPSMRPTGTTRLRWDGTGPDGLPAPDGPYRVRLTLTDAAATLTSELQVAKVSAPAYPPAPASITVFLDPGHGGADTGATAMLADGTRVRESDLDLDIALRPASMLRSAGLRVSMSRTADVEANRARVDRNGDGTVDGADEFMARMDAANRVRADLYVAIHNNWIADGKGRTETFYCGQGCPGSDASRALARSLLDAHLARLGPLQTAEWQLTVGAPSIPEAERNPTDDYLRFAWATLPAGRHFYVLGPWDAAFRPRPIEMPGALMESLALSHPYELDLLASPAIRTVLAASYYDGIASFLAGRQLGLRLDPVAPPVSPRAGAWTRLRVKVTNNGSVAIPAGSQVLVGAVGPARPYDGSPSPGRQIGAVTLAAPIRPGRWVSVWVPVRPATAGSQVWKVDVMVGGRRTSTLRVPVLQVPVKVAG